jgi:hypothetical protein
MPNVLAVAATDNTDNRAFFSNVGRRSVDLGAPGVDIYSTWPGGGYQYLSGTSMATPHVTGAAALAKAAFPSASAVGLKALLLGTVDPKPALATTTSSGGRLNIGNAVACNASPQVWIDSPGPASSSTSGRRCPSPRWRRTCADPNGVSVSATANGAPVSLTARATASTQDVHADGGRRRDLLRDGEQRHDFDDRSITGRRANVARDLTGRPAGHGDVVSGESIPVKFNGTAGERVSVALANV